MPCAKVVSPTVTCIPLADYNLFYATRADMLERTGGDPRPDLERALLLAMNEGESRLLERRLRDCVVGTQSL